MNSTTTRDLTAILADLDRPGPHRVLRMELETAVRAQLVPQAGSVTQDPNVMPASVHGEAVVSAFRQLPLYGLTDDTYTVITQDAASSPVKPRYSVFRARFAPALERWSIDTNYAVDSGLSWTQAAGEFAERVTQRVN